jgi:hypothetical protein
VVILKREVLVAAPAQQPKACEALAVLAVFLETELMLAKIQAQVQPRLILEPVLVAPQPLLLPCQAEMAVQVVASWSGFRD